MDIDAGSLLASLLVSSVGFVLFVYGRRMSRLPHGLAGITMLIFPYFVPGVFLVLALGAVIAGALWVAVKLGW
jgi:hypothetical protein